MTELATDNNGYAYSNEAMAKAQDVLKYDNANSYTLPDGYESSPFAAPPLSKEKYYASLSNKDLETKTASTLSYYNYLSNYQSDIESAA
jgi:predicted nucleotidyltransferase